MPTLSNMHLPKTKSEIEFESICLDIISTKFQQSLHKYGSKGQRQYGIDLIYKTSDNTFVVVQCKNYIKETSNRSYSSNFIQKITQDIESASKLPFYNKISKFIIMTSINTNKNIQNVLLNLNKPFCIDIWFWDDIENYICSNDKLLFKYYPTFFNNHSIPMPSLNSLISSINILKESSMIINTKYKNYKIAYYPDSDINLYNFCVDFYNIKNNLLNLKNEYYLQLQSLDLLNSIDIIVSSIPDVYDATNDYTYTNLIATIDNFLRYFTNNSNYIKFTSECNKLIVSVKAVYRKSQ